MPRRGTSPGEYAARRHDPRDRIGSLSRPGPFPPSLGHVLIVLAIVSLILAALALDDTVGRNPRGGMRGDDGLVPLVLRIERYLEAHEVDGVTMDWRYQVDAAEEIRQTVVCQLLASVELYRIGPSAHELRQIRDHADFLIGRLDRIRSHGPFDGMLAYSLLAAFEV